LIVVATSKIPRKTCCAGISTEVVVAMVPPAIV
jgi:hypothetical protein